MSLEEDETTGGVFVCWGG